MYGGRIETKVMAMSQMVWCLTCTVSRGVQKAYCAWTWSAVCCGGTFCTHYGAG